MKKLYAKANFFLLKHLKLVTFCMLISVTIGVVATKYSELKWIVALVWGFPLVTLFRLITYKYGKIPVFMHDKTWEVYRNKYSEEEVEQKYAEMSIKRATVYFIFSIISDILWVVCELFMGIATVIK